MFNISPIHLSRDIQKRLNKLKSSIKLASTIDGSFPSEYAFSNEEKRNFRTEFAYDKRTFSIVLFENNDIQDHEYCFARGIFTKLDKLTKVIHLWVGQQDDVVSIKEAFPELELYEEFNINNPNIEIDRAWTKVKNMFFNDSLFWRDTEWNKSYLEMLVEAKQHKAFENFYPFTSLHWLRFSTDKDMSEMWTLGNHITPVVYSNEIPNIVGKFYVSFIGKEKGGQYFETAKEALDFYALKLAEIKPGKWTKDK